MEGSVGALRNARSEGGGDGGCRKPFSTGDRGVGRVVRRSDVSKTNAPDIVAGFPLMFLMLATIVFCPSLSLRGESDSADDN
jgi:hypothetical protein